MLEPLGSSLRLQDHRAESPTRCWGIFDGQDDHRREVEGLCQALGGATSLVECRLPAPWSLLPGSWLSQAPNLFSNPDELERPRPRLIVSAGRQAGAASLWLNRCGAGPRAFSVHLHHPRVPLNCFDVVVAPEHERLQGANVLNVWGALHGWNASTLAAARLAPSAEIEQLGENFVAVLLGGPHRTYSFSDADVEALCARLQRLTGDGLRLAIVPSERTPQRAIQKFRRAFGERHLVGKRPSPEMNAAALSRASYFIVTCDSVSLISEATATGRPVLVEFLSERRHDDRLTEFHQSALERQLIRPFVGRIEDWTYEPPSETARVAAAISERIAVPQTRRLAG